MGGHSRWQDPDESVDYWAYPRGGLEVDGSVQRTGTFGETVCPQYPAEQRRYRENLRIHVLELTGGGDGGGGHETVTERDVFTQTISIINSVT